MERRLGCFAQRMECKLYNGRTLSGRPILVYIFCLLGIRTFNLLQNHIKIPL
jgi:hypothetical protein